MFLKVEKFKWRNIFNLYLAAKPCFHEVGFWNYEQWVDEEEREKRSQTWCYFNAQVSNDCLLTLTSWDKLTIEAEADKPISTHFEQVFLQDTLAAQETGSYDVLVSVRVGVCVCVCECGLVCTYGSVRRIGEGVWVCAYGWVRNTRVGVKRNVCVCECERRQERERERGRVCMDQ